MIFEAVKDSVTLPAAAREYGFKPNRANYISCPFHSERTPSLKLYERSFHCYGCGVGGTVIDFVAALFGLSPLDAAKKLNADFGLHIDDTPPDRKEVERRRQIREVRQLFDGWREATLNQMDAAIRTANQADYNDLSDSEVIAIRYREAFEYWSDVLLRGDLSLQMEVFRDRREVERLCRMILQNTPTRSKAV